MNVLSRLLGRGSLLASQEEEKRSGSPRDVQNLQNALEVQRPEKRSGPRDAPSALEVQRRRWSIGGWVLIILTLALVMVAILFLPQGASSSGEVQGSWSGHWVSYLRGTAAFGLLVTLAQQLFKLAVRLLDWAREKEKEQVRHLLWIKRSQESPAATLDAIKLIEMGSIADLAEQPGKASPRNSVRRKKETTPASGE